jgi:DNA-binding NarL/FixJ family response regulator
MTRQLLGREAMRGDGVATILVVEDDHNLRLLIAGLLREAGHTPIEAACGEDALVAAALTQPDLALLDVDLPNVSGYEVCRRLRELHGERLPIMFVSGVRTEAFDRVAGFLIGADDYLSKPFAPEELLARVRALLRRATPATPAVNASPKLTSRELEVLGLLADGLAQTEIATRLAISSKTVATHIERVLGKLGVHSRAQAVAVAYRDGLLQVA